MGHASLAQGPEGGEGQTEALAGEQDLSDELLLPSTPGALLEHALPALVPASFHTHLRRPIIPEQRLSSKLLSL